MLCCKYECTYIFWGYHGVSRPNDQLECMWIVPHATVLACSYVYTCKYYVNVF